MIGSRLAPTALLTLAVFSIAIRNAAGFAVIAIGRPQSRASVGTERSMFSSRQRGLVTQITKRPSTAHRAQGVQGLSATIPSDLKGRERLEKFIDDCALLGPVRFVCMTDGAVLEAVGSFDNLRYSDLPKGRFATVSEGTGFECHLNTDKIKRITMVTKRSPAGDYDLYITRFLDDAGETVLSAMLHGVEGSYEPGAADFWEKLRKTFGAEQSVA